MQTGYCRTSFWPKRMGFQTARYSWEISPNGASTIFPLRQQLFPVSSFDLTAWKNKHISSIDGQSLRARQSMCHRLLCVSVSSGVKCSSVLANVSAFLLLDGKVIVKFYFLHNIHIIYYSCFFMAWKFTVLFYWILIEMFQCYIIWGCLPSISARMNSGDCVFCHLKWVCWPRTLILEHLNVAFTSAAIWRRSLESFVFDISN